MHDTHVNTFAYELFSFITSDSKEYLAFHRPVIPQKETLEALYNNPPPDLIASISQCRTGMLQSIYPNNPPEPEPQIPVTIIGLAIAVYNCVAVNKKMDKALIEPAVSFTKALIQSIPLAKDIYTSLCYHSIIRICERQIAHFDSLQKDLFIQCINLNPVSQMVFIHLAMPSHVKALACELIPDFEKNSGSCPKIKDAQWIEQVETLLDDTCIYRWIIHQWINLPQSLESSRNIGLILETLRRRGKYEGFILDFYESCLYYQQINPSSYDLFDALNRCKTYLSTPGANKASRHFNIKGHEYFILFIPLLEITIKAGQTPCRSKHLANEMAALVMMSKELYRYMPETGGNAINFSPPEFEQEAKNV